MSLKSNSMTDDEENSKLYAVIRLSNGGIVGKESVSLFLSDNIEGVINRVKEIYTVFSSEYIVTKQIPGDLTNYLDTCLKNGLPFHYVFRGNVYGNEEIAVTDRCGIDYASDNMIYTKESDNSENERT